MLKSVFFGTPDFAVPSFEVLLKKTECLALVCQPDKPRGRGQQIIACPTKIAAQTKNIRAFSPNSLVKESDELAQLKTFLTENPADIYIVLAYGKILPQFFLEGARLGCFNIHASLLPKWRGAAPIQRSIEAGDTLTGLCIQRMVARLDAGNVIIQSTCEIRPEESAIELTNKLSLESAKLLAQFFDALEAQKLDLIGTPQDENLVTLAPKITKEEALFHSSWSIKETHNRIRAFRYWPKVWLRMSEGTEIKLLKSRIEDSNKEVLGKIRPGEWMFSGTKAYLGCSVRPGEENLCLEILEAQAPNKGPQNAFQLLSKF